MRIAILAYAWIIARAAFNATAAGAAGMVAVDFMPGLFLNAWAASIMLKGATPVAG